MAKKKEVLTLEEKLVKALVPEEEQPYTVPQNWVWTYVGAVSKFIGGGTPSKNKSEYWGGNISWASVKDIKGDYLYDTLDKITEFGVENSSTNLCEIDDLILITRIEPGKTIISKIKTTINQDLKIVKSNINFLFLHYYYKTFQNEFIRKSSGSTVQGITLKNVSDMTFPLPPLAEQQRIVDRIESLFSKLDEAKEKAQSALDSFENRKAAILHQAFTGELTQKWREENGVSFSSWEEKEFENFCFLNRGFDLPAKDRTEGEYSLVTSSGETDTHNQYKVKAPGVITGRSGTIGKVFYIEKDYWPLNTTLYSKKTYNNNVKYIYYFLVNFDFKKYSSSTAVPTLNRNNFSKELIQVPSFSEQTEIVRILDNVFEKEKQAKELADVIEKIDFMKKAILGRAFRGELGTNDPKEESALELLKEILQKEDN